MWVRGVKVGLVVLFAVGACWVRAGREHEARADGPQNQSELIRHGEYLVSSVGMCGDCHTPRDDHGKLDRAKLLQGATLSIQPRTKIRGWMDEAPDITSGGLAGDWGEEGMAKFLMTGDDPDDENAMPPMPAFRMNDRDAHAVAAYLKSLGGSKDEKK